MKPDWESKAERLLQWIAEGKNSPYTLEIHPTFRCNLHCVFCDQEEWRQRGLMDYSLEIGGGRWLEIIDEAAAMGVREVRVCGGGEPMYDLKTIIPIFQRIKARGMAGYLTTNGTMFNNTICRMMVKIGWDKIEFSVDGATAETHDALRGVPGCFERVVDAIRTISEHKRRSGKERPFIIINVVVSKRNFQEIPGMVELFGPMGVDELLLLHLHPGGQAGDSLVVPAERKAALWEAVRNAKQLAEEHGMRLEDGILSVEDNRGERSKEEIVLSVDPGNNSDSGDGAAGGQLTTAHPGKLAGNPDIIKLITAPCYEPWYYMQILNDGTYGPCCNAYFDKNAEWFHEAQLGEVWLKGSHILKVRADLLKKEFKGVCRECDAVNLIRAKRIRKRLLELCEKRGILPAETIQVIRNCADNMLRLQEEQQDV